jgi:hypothetical protein
MATQKHMGKGKLVKRLTAQVGSSSLAHALLKKRGDMDAKGKLTAKGRKRNAMTASERAKDRATKSSGKPTKDYKYNPKTNRATLKGKK